MNQDIQQQLLAAAQEASITRLAMIVTLLLVVAVLIMILFFFRWSQQESRSNQSVVVHLIKVMRQMGRTNALIGRALDKNTAQLEQVQNAIEATNERIRENDRVLSAVLEQTQNTTRLQRATYEQLLTIIKHILGSESATRADLESLSEPPPLAPLSPTDGEFTPRSPQ